MEDWRYSHTTTVGCKKSIEVKYYYNKDAKLKKVYSNGKEEIIDKVTKGKGGERIYITIAKLFPEICGEWFKGCQVDHLNCNRNDNNAENLRCCTPSENMQNPLTRQHCKEAMYKRIEDGVYKDVPDKLKGHKAWNKGLKMDENHKLKLSESHKGLKYGPRSEETKKKMREAAKNRPPVSDETRKKLSEAKLKNPSKYWLGKKLPEEMKQKIKESWERRRKRSETI